MGALECVRRKGKYCNIDFQKETVENFKNNEKTVIKSFFNTMLA